MDSCYIINAEEYSSAPLHAVDKGGSNYAIAYDSNAIKARSKALQLLVEWAESMGANGIRALRYDPLVWIESRQEYLASVIGTGTYSAEFDHCVQHPCSDKFCQKCGNHRCAEYDHVDRFLYICVECKKRDDRSP